MTDTFELRGKAVWVAGHTGMVGSALLRRLAGTGCRVLTVTRAELDLRDQAAVRSWVLANRPDAVFIAAGTVGGIQANDAYPADFAYDNLMIAANIIHAAHEAAVSKLMFLGSSCIYPRLADQPMAEASLWTGPLEPTNQPYAVAKLAGITLCDSYRRQFGRDFVSALPANLYGPGDSLDPARNHVIPALIEKVLAAKSSGGPVEIWGTGSPRREFMYVDDAADAMVFLMQNWSDDGIINVGTGEDVSIAELAKEIAEVTGYTGAFAFQTEKPDGMPRKRLDSDRLLALGWRPKTTLRVGLEQTVEWIEDARRQTA